MVDVLTVWDHEAKFVIAGESLGAEEIWRKMVISSWGPCLLWVVSEDTDSEVITDTVFVLEMNGLRWGMHRLVILSWGSPCFALHGG